jgi:hypothetical protein
MFQKKKLEEIKTHISCPAPFFGNRAVYEIMFIGAGHR